MATPVEQVKDVWGRLKPASRVVVIGAAVLTLAFALSLVFYFSGEEYSVLFSDLKPTDAQTIVEKLKSSNVSYKLTNNGTTISVPSNRVSELRLEMASSGVLSGGHVGFDLFDKTNFGATDFAQQVNYQRALEGEIARTLEGMEEVESARVHITRAKESIFAEKEEKAKASIMLRVKQGRELSRERTEAVINLVSSAIEGLDPADVSVMDARGRVLSAGNRDGQNDAGSFNSHLEAKRRLEAETAARVVSLLEPISGVGHVRADVATDVDFSQVEQTEEKYDPKSQVVRSQQTQQEIKNNGARGPAGGVTGARANDPTTQPSPNPTPIPNADQRTSTTTNYEIDKIVKHTIGKGGRITRLSVSVVVDYKNSNGVMITRTPEELKKIQEVVAAAVGVDAQRGDQIVVQSIPFDQPTVEVANLTWMQRNRDLIPLFIKYGALVLIAILLLLFVVRPAKRAIMAALTPHTPELLPATANGAPLALTAGELAAAETIVEKALVNNGEVGRTVAELEADLKAELERETHFVTPEVKRTGAIKKLLVEQSQGDPEMLAKTIRGWLNEDS
jgi:flagellar M-ring protein FliF